MISPVLSFLTSKMHVAEMKQGFIIWQTDWAEVTTLSHLCSSLSHPDLKLSLTHYLPLERTEVLMWFSTGTLAPAVWSVLEERRQGVTRRMVSDRHRSSAISPGIRTRLTSYWETTVFRTESGPGIISSSPLLWSWRNWRKGKKWLAWHGGDVPTPGHIPCPQTAPSGVSGEEVKWALSWKS